jgi:hypothetical protein
MGALGRTLVVAYTISWVMFLLLIMLCGFVLAKGTHSLYPSDPQLRLCIPLDVVRRELLTSACAYSDQIRFHPKVQQCGLVYLPLPQVPSLGGVGGQAIRNFSTPTL